MTTALKLVNTDNGNCRVYYKSEAKRLFCFQESSRGRFELLVCSRDGEPSHPVAHSSVQLDKLPAEECSTSKAFVTWYTSLQQKEGDPVTTRKPASELRVGDCVMRKGGYLRRVELITHHQDRVNVGFDPEVVYSPTQIVEVVDGASQVEQGSAQAPAAATEVNLIEVRASSSCRCEEECDCPREDSLTFTVNGVHGHGGGELVAEGPQGQEFYSCNFMGWAFKAKSAFDAKKQIENRYRAFIGFRVELN